MKGIITQEEYDKGLRVIETKERLTRPTFNVDVNNGLNIRVGERFLLKLRLLAQARYSYATYNSAWGTVGDSRNPARAASIYGICLGPGFSLQRVVGV